MCDVNVPEGSIIEVTNMNGESFLAVVADSTLAQMGTDKYTGYPNDGQSLWVVSLTGEFAGDLHAVREDEEDRWQRIHGHIHIDRAQRYALA